VKKRKLDTNGSAKTEEMVNSGLAVLVEFTSLFLSTAEAMRCQN